MPQNLSPEPQIARNAVIRKLQCDSSSDVPRIRAWAIVNCKSVDAAVAVESHGFNAGNNNERTHAGKEKRHSQSFGEQPINEGEFCFRAACDYIAM